jgi:ABC-type lipoprotein export system ATPase subunit
MGLMLAVQDLYGCANTLIGDELQGIKGISGGQRRRVSVGIELVKDPHIIFLDGEVHSLSHSFLYTSAPAAG